MTHVRHRVQPATDPPRSRPLCVEQRTAEMKSVCLYSSFLGCTNSAPHQNVCDQHVGIVKIPTAQNRFSNFPELKNCKSSTFMIFDHNRKVPIRIFSKVLQDTYILVFSSEEDATLLDKYDRCTIPELVEKHQELPTSLFWQVPKELFPQGVQFVYKGHPKKIFPIRLRIGSGGVRVDQLQKVELADGELGMMMSVTIDVRSGLPTQQMKLLLQIGTNYYEVLAARRASAPAEVFDFAIPLRHLRQLAGETNTVPVQLIRPLLSNKLEAKVDRDVPIDPFSRVPQFQFLGDIGFDQVYQPIGIQQRPQPVTTPQLQPPSERHRASHSPSPAPSHGSASSSSLTTPGSPLSGQLALASLSEAAQQMVARLQNEVYRLQREVQAEREKRHAAERDRDHERKEFTNFREELLRVQQQQQQSINLLNLQQQHIMSPSGTASLQTAAALGTLQQQQLIGSAPSVASSNIPLKLEGGTSLLQQQTATAIGIAALGMGSPSTASSASSQPMVSHGGGIGRSNGTGPGPGGGGATSSAIPNATSGFGTQGIYMPPLDFGTGAGVNGVSMSGSTDLSPLKAFTDLPTSPDMLIGSLGGSNSDLGRLSPRTLHRRGYGLGDSEKDLGSKGGSHSSLFGMGSSNSLLGSFPDDTEMRDVGQLPLMGQSSLTNLKQLTPPSSFTGLSQT